MPWAELYPEEWHSNLIQLALDQRKSTTSRTREKFLRSLSAGLSFDGTLDDLETKLVAWDKELSSPQSDVVLPNQHTVTIKILKILRKLFDEPI